MIQLYDLQNTNYEMNGDYTLQELNASLHLVLNGEWCLDLTIEQDAGGSWKHLAHDSVIKIKLPRYGYQLFVVSNPKRTNFETVSCQAYPIALWDARNELICFDCRPTNLTGADAAGYILAGCSGGEKYRIESDISAVSTAYYIRKNLIECLTGDAENAFIKRWGGELIFDNFTFRLNESAGVDNGLRIEASRNLSGFAIDEDDSDFVSEIIPVGYNGWCKGVSVVREDGGRIRHKRFVDYENVKYFADASEDDYTDPDVIVCKTEAEMNETLEQKARESFENGEFMPAFTYSIDFADIKNADSLAGFERLFDVWLGDIVHVENLDNRIETRQKVIELTYDLIADEITSLVLGAKPKDFFNAASSAVATLGSVVSNENGQPSLVGEKVRGIIDMMEVSMQAQKNASVKSDTRAILFEDTDPNSATYGAMSIGTQGLQISRERNESDTGWKWGTAINYKSVIADAIVTGLLSGHDGNFWFDLDTGNFELGSGLFKGTIDTLKDAKIGTKVWLKRSQNTGIYVGEPGDGKAQPYLHFDDFSGLGRSVTLSTGSGQNTALTMYESDTHTNQGTARLESDTVTVKASDHINTEAEKHISLKSKNDSIDFESKRINVIKDGKTYVGANFEGEVTSIQTVNGIVVKAS